MTRNHTASALRTHADIVEGREDQAKTAWVETAYKLMRIAAAELEGLSDRDKDNTETIVKLAGMLARESKRVGT